MPGDLSRPPGKTHEGFVAHSLGVPASLLVGALVGAFEGVGACMSGLHLLQWGRIKHERF